MSLLSSRSAAPSKVMTAYLFLEISDLKTHNLLNRYKSHVINVLDGDPNTPKHDEQF